MTVKDLTQYQDYLNAKIADKEEEEKRRKRDRARAKQAVDADFEEQAKAPTQVIGTN